MAYHGYIIKSKKNICTSNIISNLRKIVDKNTRKIEHRNRKQKNKIINKNTKRKKKKNYYCSSSSMDM